MKTEAKKDLSKRFRQAVNSLQECTAPKKIEAAQYLLKNMQKYAEEISQLPGVNLEDFTAALEKVINLYNSPTDKVTQKQVEEVCDLATKYYNFLIIKEMKRFEIIFTGFYNKEKDPALKAKMEKFYFRLHALSNLSSAITFSLVEWITDYCTRIIPTFNNHQYVEQFLDREIQRLSDKRKAISTSRSRQTHEIKELHSNTNSEEKYSLLVEEDNSDPTQEMSFVQAASYVRDHIDFFIEQIIEEKNFTQWLTKQETKSHEPFDQLNGLLRTNKELKKQYKQALYYCSIARNTLLLQDLFIKNPKLLEAINAQKNSSFVDLWYQTKSNLEESKKDKNQSGEAIVKKNENLTTIQDNLKKHKKENTTKLKEEKHQQTQNGRSKASSSESYVGASYLKIEADGEVYQLAGDGKDAKNGLSITERDYSGGLVINNKTNKMYVMWLKWLRNLDETQAELLSPIDEKVRTKLKDIDLQPSEYTAPNLINTKNLELSNIFQIFLKRELNISDENFDETSSNINKKYTQGVGSSDGLLNGFFSQFLSVYSHNLKITNDEKISDSQDHKERFSKAWRHYSIHGIYKVRGLKGNLVLQKNGTTLQSIEIDASGYCTFTNNGYKVQSLGGSIHPLLMPIFQSTTDQEIRKNLFLRVLKAIPQRKIRRVSQDIRNKFYSATLYADSRYLNSNDNDPKDFEKQKEIFQEEFIKAFWKIVSTEINEEKNLQQKRFKQALKNFKRCPTPISKIVKKPGKYIKGIGSTEGRGPEDQKNNISTLSTILIHMKRHAEEIGQLPDVILADFTDALAKITAILQKNTQDITQEEVKEIQDLAAEYYGLLVINEQEKLNETVLKIYNEEKNDGIKAKLGEILFVHLDRLSKLPNPMVYRLVEKIREVHTEISDAAKNNNLNETLDFVINDLSVIAQPVMRSVKAYKTPSKPQTPTLDTKHTPITMINGGDLGNGVELGLEAGSRPASSTSNHPNSSNSMQRRPSMQISPVQNRKGAVNPEMQSLLSQSTNGTHSHDSKRISTPAADMTSPPRPQPPAPVEIESVEIKELKKELTPNSNVDEAIKFVEKNLNFFAALFLGKENFQEFGSQISSLYDELQQTMTHYTHGKTTVIKEPYIDALIGSNNLLSKKIAEYKKMSPSELAKKLKNQPTMLKLVSEYKGENCLRNGNPSKLRALLNENSQMVKVILDYKRNVKMDVDRQTSNETKATSKQQTEENERPTELASTSRTVPQINTVPHEKKRIHQNNDESQIIIKNIQNELRDRGDSYISLGPRFNKTQDKFAKIIRLSELCSHLSEEKNPGQSITHFETELLSFYELTMQNRSDCFTFFWDSQVGQTTNEEEFFERMINLVETLRVNLGIPSQELREKINAVQDKTEKRMINALGETCGPSIKLGNSSVRNTNGLFNKKPKPPSSTRVVKNHKYHSLQPNGDTD